MLSRRTILAASALAALSRPSLADDPIRLRVSTAAPPSDFLAKCLEQFKQEVEAAHAGVTAEIYPAGALFKQGTEIQALQRGNLEMSTMTTFEVAQQIPEYGFFNRAYLFRDYDHMRHVFDGPIAADYRKVVSDKMGIEILATLYLGTRQVNLRAKRDVKLPADLAGTKLRMPGGPEWLLLGRTLGVNPVPMGMPEVYLAMKTGTIDGQENPLSVMGAAKLYEVSEEVVLTAHMLQPVFINIATPVWNKLNPAQKTLVETAAIHAAKTNDDGRLADEATVLASLKSRGLVIAAPDLAAFRANADTVYASDNGAKVWNKDLLKRVIDTPWMWRAARLFADGVGAAMFAAVFVLFCLKVGMRYFLHDELAWTDEVATILFIWIVFWANAFMLGDHDHIRFDLVVHVAGPRTRRVMAVARALLVGGIFLYALPGTIDYILFLWREKTPVLLLRLDYVYACFGIFAATVPIRAVLTIMRARHRA